MKLVIGSYVIDNVSNTAYEDFITYYNGTPASYITQNDIDKWNTPTDLSAYAKFSDISAMGYITQHQSLSDYPTFNDISGMGYITQNDIVIPEIDLSAYVTKTDYNSDQEIVAAALNDLSYSLNKNISYTETLSYNLNNLQDSVNSIVIPEVDTSNFVSYEYLNAQGYLTSHQSLTDYPTFNDISGMGYITSNDIPSVDLSSYVTKIEYNEDQEIIAASLNDLSYKVNHIDIPSVDLSSYVTKEDLSTAGYITSHQSLSDYVSKSDLSNASYVTSGDLSYYVSSSTSGVRIEVVSAMPVSPNANTIYLVQAS